MSGTKEYLRYRMVKQPRRKFPYIRFADTIEEANDFFRLGKGTPHNDRRLYAGGSIYCAIVSP